MKRKTRSFSIFHKGSNTEFAGWMRGGIACAVAQRRELGAGREAPIVGQLEQKGCRKSQKMKLKGNSRKDYNRLCILAE